MAPHSKRPMAMYPTMGVDHRNRPLPCKPGPPSQKSQVSYKAWALTAVLSMAVCTAVVFCATWAGGLLGAGGIEHLDQDIDKDYHNEPMSRLMGRRNLNLKPPSMNAALTYEYDSTVKEVKNELPKLPESVAEHADVQSMIIPVEDNKNSSDLDSKLREIVSPENIVLPSEAKTEKEVVKAAPREIAIKDVNKNKKWLKDIRDSMDRTQISSPDDAVGQPTTNLAHTNREALPINTLQPLEEDMLMHDEKRIQKKDSAVSQQVVLQDTLNESPGFIPPQYDDLHYGPDEYFYSENDAENYYYDYETSNWPAFMLEKLQDLYGWVTNDMDVGGELSKGSTQGNVPQVLKALNDSLSKGDITILITRLKDLYFKDTTLEWESTERRLDNTSSPAAFGLLALDVLLLRNIQLMAWDDQATANSEMMRDPELFALNALFMDPVRVKEVYQQLERQRSRQWNEGDILEVRGDELSLSSLTSSFYSNTDAGRDLLDFAMSTARAAAYLGRAFRSAKSQEAKKQAEAAQMNRTVERLRNGEYKQFKEIPAAHSRLIQSSMKGHGVNSNMADSTVQNERSDMTELDCIWTLYCRNLDKTTKIGGPYGFLAILNSLGLRLVAGELPMERALDALVDESLGGAQSLNCDRLFPRCSGKNASKIVIESIIGKTSISENKL